MGTKTLWLCTAASYRALTELKMVFMLFCAPCFFGEIFCASCLFFPAAILQSELEKKTVCTSIVHTSSIRLVVFYPELSTASLQSSLLTM